jgi:broad specificity phosphatase PhoE
MSSGVQLWLMRHGETEWSRAGAHTSRTDLPLTSEGERRAENLKRLLGGRSFALVLTSPMRRAIDTCRLAGYGVAAEITPDLREWDYGTYEGRTTADIQTGNPGWTIWTGTPPGGETAEQVGARADRVIERALSAAGDVALDVALFGHGHMLRVVAARWLVLEPAAGRYFALSTGSVSVLGWEREARVIERWNQTI